MACKRPCGTSEIQNDKESTAIDGLCCTTGPFGGLSRVEASMADVEANLMSSFDIAHDCRQTNGCTRSFHSTCGCGSLGPSVKPNLAGSSRCCTPSMDKRHMKPNCQSSPQIFSNIGSRKNRLVALEGIAVVNYPNTCSWLAALSHELRFHGWRRAASAKPSQALAKIDEKNVSCHVHGESICRPSVGEAASRR